MATIRPALPGDIEALVVFLSQWLSPTPERHRRILAGGWDANAPNIGYLIQDADGICGFIGALYSHRHIRGQLHRLCNMTSYTVAPAGRAQSLGLLKTLLAAPDVTFTNYSASATVQKILQLFRFQSLDRGRTLLWAPAAAPRAWLSAHQQVQWDASIEDEHLRRLVDGHRQWGCVPLRLRNSRDHSERLLILQPHRDASRRVADLLYCSDWSAPDTWQPASALAAWRRLRCPWLAVDSRRAASAHLARRVEKPAFFLSRTGLDADDIDRLGTESVIRFGMDE